MNDAENAANHEAGTNATSIEDLRAMACRKGTDIAARALRELEIVFPDHEFVLSNGDGTIVCDPPILVSGSTVGSFCVMDALHGTVPSPEMEAPVLRIARLLDSVAEVEVNLPLLISSSQDSRFAAFVRSRRHTDDLRTLDGYDSGGTAHPIPGWIYEDQYAIEIANDQWPEESLRQGGFHLVYENRSIVSNDLSDLERRLYDAMVRPTDD